MTQAPRTGFETPVVKRMPDGTRVFPDSTKIRDINLPARLQPGQVVTPAQLEEVAGITPGTIQQMIDQARADVLAQVNQMLQNLPTPQTVYIFNQPVPTATAVIHHNLGRRAVAVTVYSDDYQTQYEFFEVHPQSDNSVALSFDDPLTFVAVVS